MPKVVLPHCGSCRRLWAKFRKKCYRHDGSVRPAVPKVKPPAVAIAKVPCPSCGRPCTLRSDRNKGDCRYCRPTRPPKPPSEDELMAARIEMHMRRTAGLSAMGFC